MLKRFNSMYFFFSSRRRHTRCYRDWSSDVCSSDLGRDLVRDVQHFLHETKCRPQNTRQNPAVFRYMTRRVLWAIALFVVVTIVTYVIFFIIPVDPARNACGQRASQTCIELARKTLGLDKPVYRQYADFLWKLTYHHDLGRSFVNRQSVNAVVARAAPVTASVAIGGMLVMLLVAFPIGILYALRPRTKLDRAAMTFALAGVSIPTFWTGLMASFLIGFKLGWTPIQGYCDLRHDVIGCYGPAQWAWHLALPWVVFGLHHSAYYIRMIRATLMEAMADDYVKTARAKGASEMRVVWLHAMRNAILPVVTMFG